MLPSPLLLHNKILPPCNTDVLATYPRALRLSYSLLNGDRRDVRPCSFFSIVFFGGIIINGGVRAGAGASPDGAKNRLILKTNAYWRPSTSYVLYLSRNNTALAAEEGKDLDSVVLLLLFVGVGRRA